MSNCYRIYFVDGRQIELFARGMRTHYDDKLDTVMITFLWDGPGEVASVNAAQVIMAVAIRALRNEPELIEDGK